MNDDASAQALRRSKREPEAFARFYEEHVESLLAYAMRRVWDVDELPYTDVADSLGISQQAARARVARGLKALAAALDRQPSLKEGLP